MYRKVFYCLIIALQLPSESHQWYTLKLISGQSDLILVLLVHEKSTFFWLAKNKFKFAHKCKVVTSANYKYWAHCQNFVSVLTFCDVFFPVNYNSAKCFYCFHKPKFFDKFDTFWTREGQSKTIWNHCMQTRHLVLNKVGRILSCSLQPEMNFQEIC